MKLNKKGYMLVEIIIASVLAMSIAFYLLNLTYKFKNNSEDIYHSHNYMSDKILITKNIMSDLDKGTIVGDVEPIAENDYTRGITFSLKDDESGIEEPRKLLIEKDSNSTIMIKYGKSNGNEFDTDDISYYEKKIESTLVVGTVEISEANDESKDPDSLSIRLPIKSIYDANDYSVKLYAKKLEINKIVATYYNDYNWLGELDSNSIRKIVFGSNKCGANSGIAINAEGANEVRACLDNDTLYIDSLNGEVIYFNENQGGFFYGMTNLEEVIFNNVDTSLTTDMREMFNGCYNLVKLDLSNWDTNNVIDMSGMFKNCSSLKKIDISSWNTSNVKYMGGYKWVNGNKENIRGMFQGCKSLTIEELESILEYIDTSKVENMSYMFEGCVGLFGTLNFDAFTNFKTEFVTDMSYMFSRCGSLDNNGLKLELYLNDFDTSQVTNMSGMFEGCTYLQTLVFANWDTANVTNMHNMFDKCGSLLSLDVSSFDTSKVTGMTYMFFECTLLNEIIFGSGWNTQKVAKMTAMFAGCKNLVELNIAGWNTSAVTDMKGMFYGCYKLEQIDLSRWDTSKVNNIGSFYASNKYIGGMFEDCKKIKTTITIKNANCTNYENIFRNAANMDDAKIIVNYTSETSNLVDLMIATKDNTYSNIEKGELKI